MALFRNHLLLGLVCAMVHSWKEDGKCHPRFLECLPICVYACSHDSNVDHLPAIGLKADVLNSDPGARLVDCSVNDFERRLHLPIIVQAIKAVHDVLDSTHHGINESTESSRFREYGTLGKSDPGLFSWSCTDHCEYECMHHVSTTLTSPVKFFGKWPFKRVSICQEFLSSFYSVLNAVPYAYLFTNKRFILKAGWSIKLYAGIATILWLASALFHCRDNQATMFIDYFSAFAGVVGNLWLAIYSTVTRDHRRAVTWTALGLWSGHVGYMTFVEFNFEWNMILAATLALLANIAWTVWSISKKRKYSWMVLIATWSLVPLFLLMEANDFPPGPYGLADAHSYWHLSTVPVSCLWALFFYQEVIYR
jgi:hypothetical protein